MIKRRHLVFFILCIIFLGLIYFFIDPSIYHMPRCPFYSLTGYQCPGCGSQRALHALLHLNIPTAFTYNPLMVISLPYVLLGFMLNFFNKNKPWVKWLRINLFGIYAIWGWIIIIFAFGIFRNIY